MRKKVTEPADASEKTEENAAVRGLVRWAPVALLAAAIFLLSSVPSVELPRFGSWDTFAKKGAHALGYGLLAAALWRGFGWSGKKWWLAFGLAAAYAITDELHQRTTPGRHSSVVDVCIDSAAAAVAIAACALARRKRRSR
jgi:VanZ family protein